MRCAWWSTLGPYTACRTTKAVACCPSRAPVALLVYRSPEHDVRYLELGQFARTLLSSLLNERLSLRLALSTSAESLGRSLDDELLARAARLLAELAERGALLGKSG